MIHRLSRLIGLPYPLDPYIIRMATDQMGAYGRAATGHIYVAIFGSDDCRSAWNWHRREIMAWELGPYFLEAGRSARLGFEWSDGGYKGIQMVQPRPQLYGEGGFVIVVGGRAEVAVTSHSVVFDPPSRRYQYIVDVTARDGDWYQFNLRGNRVD